MILVLDLGSPAKAFVALFNRFDPSFTGPGDWTFCKESVSSNGIKATVAWADWKWQGAEICWHQWCSVFGFRPYGYTWRCVRFWGFPRSPGTGLIESTNFYRRDKNIIKHSWIFMAIVVSWSFETKPPLRRGVMQHMLECCWSKQLCRKENTGVSKPMCWKLYMLFSTLVLFWGVDYFLTWWWTI